ncbi:hypothetical protein [uncultured Desulfovibrio sp.]|uniref:hypothetical protein n=1 Tax=uncultured Desulfovibrio sp. TaxID=167968 RepID=UPI002729EB4E|nr:hypothetical protein [uncultured Desulfovibrio sp.]
MANIQLFDKLGNEINPKTLAGLVILSGGGTVEEKIIALEAALSGQTGCHVGEDIKARDALIARASSPPGRTLPYRHTMSEGIVWRCLSTVCAAWTARRKTRNTPKSARRERNQPLSAGMKTSRRTATYL